MSNISLGRLESVELRDAWKSEAGDFTPWLAENENLKLLGDAIGIELELETQEKNVGPFRADILCRDSANGSWVLIENQLERTDHGHLGQLITYAAGLNAVTIVWIAQRFSDEHRAALDWLNEITGSGFNFFGIQVELWRIGSSPVAPRFHIVSQPNDWSRAVIEGVTKRELTETQALQLRFWQAFYEYALENGAHFKPTKPQPTNWMALALGRSGINLAAVISTWNTLTQSWEGSEVRAELYSDPSNNEWFHNLEDESESIHGQLGFELDWRNPEDKRSRKAVVRSEGHLSDEQYWPQDFAWLLEKLNAMYDVFSVRVR